MALPTIISRLSIPDAPLHPGIQMSAIIICFAYLAKGPQPGEYLVFSDSGEAQWFTLFRGARSIIKDTLMAQIRRERMTDSLGTPDSTGYERQLPPDFIDRFQRFHEFLSNAAVGEEAFQVPLDAMNLLKTTMVARYGLPVAWDEGDHKYSHVLFSWLYRISDDFLSTLAQKRPASLVIFSFYATLLRDYHPRWMMNDWPDHIEDGIRKYLHPRYKQWVENPEQSGEGSAV
ncbi:hypothetical protein KVT40_002171 [Elsinoe batatas]|uniref:Uncharacterized protein n=1 Tax=Elsinoe batatas TaxID=2601811 RepID=A0A8K0L7V8_9PEZI|nr:hypothetical protein KVT40_002171 [Elsinoe batatas]